MSFTDDPARKELADELHSRPSPVLSPPASLINAALRHGPGEDRVRDHVVELCRRYGAPPPYRERHHEAQLGKVRMRFEQHTEFVGLTFDKLLEPGEGPFERSPLQSLPQDWLSRVPAEAVAVAHVALVDSERAEITPATLERWFEGQRLVGGRPKGGMVELWTALREDGAGATRYLLAARAEAPPERLGRVVQRVVEIDTYRMMALLGLPAAKGVNPGLLELEARLPDLVRRLEAAQDLAAEGGLLNELFELAGSVERLREQVAFRFSATNAYASLVRDRLEGMEEDRGDERQRLGRFLERRFVPAVRTCQSTEERLEALSRRIGRTADLARTRVDVTLQRQNKELLASMERRAKLQLRLQETVEGLSVVAISYYALGLLSYLLYGTLAQPTAKLVLASALPLVAGGVWLALRLAKRRMRADEAASTAPSD